MSDNSSAPPAPHAFAAAKAALYRRYRPETFADVIGQEHVTEPLMRALDNNRIGHAYLFSGPRGCGKTTSARILARCLNCAQGPTSTPCGTCGSCIELSRDGSGSLDVVEIDAASHGGVDDARELRERATFAPARDRYKIFILDEAHMVTAHGFNALLKLVEEPPPHVKFIFATTEPEKVIGTIRSRTHHYPFRLIPATVLTRYLEHLCASEGVPVEKGVLPLVVRAGTGSARDTLSVLDQLMAGSGAAGIAYDTAVNLLGFTDGELLDSVIDALAAGDATSVFQAVDRVVTTGHDPRRFVEDLLDRFRDLIIAAAVPDSLEALLPGMPVEHLDTLRRQASLYGAAALSRSADVTNDALTSMHGPTAPRIQLELLCARLLLPGADASGAGSAPSGGLAARVELLERRLGASSDAAPGFPAPNTGGYAAPASQRVAQSGDEPEHELPPGVSARDLARAAARRSQGGGEAARQSGAMPVQPREPGAQPVPQAQAQAQPVPVSGAMPVQPREPVAQPVPQPQPQAQPVPVSGAMPVQPREPQPVPQPQREPQPGHALGSIDTAAIRTAWPNILDRLREMRRVAWMTLSQHGQVINLANGTLNIAFRDAGPMRSFLNSGADQLLARAVFDELGIRVTIDVGTGQHVTVEPAQPRASTANQRPAPQRQTRPDAPPATAPVASHAAPPMAPNTASPEAQHATPPPQTPTRATDQGGFGAGYSAPQPARLTQPAPRSEASVPEAPTPAPAPTPTPAPAQLGYDEWPEVAQPPAFVADEVPPTGPVPVQSRETIMASATEYAPIDEPPFDEPDFVTDLYDAPEPAEAHEPTSTPAPAAPDLAPAATPTVETPRSPASSSTSVPDFLPPSVAEALATTQSAAEPPTASASARANLPSAVQRALAAAGANADDLEGEAPAEADVADPWLARDPEHRPGPPPAPKPGTEATASAATSTPPAPTPPRPAPAPETGAAAAARAALSAAQEARRTGANQPAKPAASAYDYDDADPDDPSVDMLSIAGPEVVKQLLGGEIIEEITET